MEMKRVLYRKDVYCVSWKGLPPILDMKVKRWSFEAVSRPARRVASKQKPSRYIREEKEALSNWRVVGRGWWGGGATRRLRSVSREGFEGCGRPR